MTETTPKKNGVHVLTIEEAQARIAELVEKSGMSRDELFRLGAAWELDAQHRGILANIEGLEYLLKLAEQ
ncbi:MAG: hypothetical protein GX542_01205 [Rhodococcus sp.]|nr:hypothetical protein [Rhodococcus sp. (in: high G+C Gram-positive bacteria)]